MPGLRARIAQYERGRQFWKLVEVRGREECWPWLGALDHGGRATFEGRLAAPRAFELARGRPPAAPLRHSCRNPACVNPQHLRPR